MVWCPPPLNHVGITVPDIFAAIDWYAEVFGFTCVMGPRLLEAEVGGARETSSVFGPGFRRAYQAHLLTSNSVGLEMFQFVEPEVAEREPEMVYWRRGVFHLCFTCPDVAAMAKRISTSGGVQRTTVFAFVPGRPWRLVYCVDPWGNSIEIISHSYAEIFSNWPQPGMTTQPIFIQRPNRSQEE